MLGNTNESNQLGMMPNPYRGHYLPSKLFFSIRRTDIILNFLNSHLSTPPLPFKHLRRMPKPYLLLKPQSPIVNEILLCIFLHLLYNKLLQIDKAIPSFRKPIILINDINLFYFIHHLFLFLLDSFLLSSHSSIFFSLILFFTLFLFWYFFLFCLFFLFGEISHLVYAVKLEFDLLFIIFQGLFFLLEIGDHHYFIIIFLFFDIFEI